MSKVKSPHLCPICKKAIRERKTCFPPLYCCKAHWMQDPNSSYHRRKQESPSEVGIVLRLIILYIILPISIILGVMHNRWEWWQLRRVVISFSIAAVLTIVTGIIALLLGYWLYHVISTRRSSNGNKS